ncbi:MAG: ATP-binding cassette domain-containing protein [Ignavibacteriaceae bacterium]|nr:ATP-binding cassette domain-containing protein [Ignavibacteriaceae bacterium]
MIMEIFRLENICYSVSSAQEFEKKGVINILDNINLNINYGEVLGISGESGGGKTTLAKVIAGVIKPTQGKLVWDDDVSSENNIASPVQILFQNHGEILNPYRKIEDTITEALKIQKWDAELVVRKKNEILSSLNISSDIFKKKGFELSGGEQQRAALARLLAANPKMLILDEPFSAQDVESQLNLLKLFKRINKEHKLTMICVSHDLNVLRKLADRIAIVQRGKIVEEGSTEEVFNNPVHNHTKYLLKAKDLSLTLSELKE